MRLPVYSLPFSSSDCTKTVKGYFSCSFSVEDRRLPKTSTTTTTTTTTATTTTCRIKQQHLSCALLELFSGHHLFSLLPTIAVFVVLAAALANQLLLSSCVIKLIASNCPLLSLSPLFGCTSIEDCADCSQFQALQK